MSGMFYSLEQAAEKLKISKEEVLQIVKQGRLREFRADQNNVLFKIDEVESLSTELTQRGKPAKEADDMDFDMDITSEGIDQPETSDEEILSLGDEDDQMFSLEEDADIFQPAEKPEDEKESQDDIFLVDEEETEKPLSKQPESEEISMVEEDEDDFGLSVDENEDESKESESNLTNEDTSVTTQGISLLGDTDSDYNLSEDTVGETKLGSSEASLEEIEDDVNLDTFGSGSGLLDLSLQADDTSLGGILDEIYTSEGEPEAEAGKPSDGESVSAEQILSESGITDAQVAEGPAVMVHAMVEPEADKSSKVYGAMLVIPAIVLLYTTLVAIAGQAGVMVSIVKGVKDYILYALAGLLVVAIIMAIVGAMPEGSTTKVKTAKAPKAPKAPKAAKAPKAVKQKPVKEPKPVKQKKKK